MVNLLTWRILFILNVQEIQTGVDVKSVCLYLNRNVFVAMSGIFWRKN